MSMGRDILISVLLGSVVLTLMLPVSSRLKGWKATLLPFLWVGAVLLVWSLLSSNLRQ